MVSLLEFIDVADYICGYMYIEPSVYLRDEEDLIMMDDLVDMILNSICKHFIEIFFLYSSRRLTFNFLLFFFSFLVLWPFWLDLCLVLVKWLYKKKFEVFLLFLCCGIV